MTRLAYIPKADKFVVRYKSVYHLNPENLAVYEAITYPSPPAITAATWGTIKGASSAAGEMVGFAVAEHGTPSDSEFVAELLSLTVLPAYRQQGIGTALVRNLQ